MLSKAKKSMIDKRVTNKFVPPPHQYFKQSLSVLNALCLLGSQVLADGIKIDMSTSGSHPTLDKTPNGIDIIQIAKPNDAGISNNFYTDFNISQDGLILNNIAKDDKLAQSILAGYISANDNLTSSAKLILNQVTGNDISKLLGYLEVAGKSADVIIANPNGITCQGCGFLNIENLTLATGRFSESELERLALLKSYQELKSLSLDITQGKIITQALDARNTKSLTFLARSMEVDGVINGGDKIRMLLGANHVEFSPSVLLYEPIKLDDSIKPALALDVAYLGGAVAKSIYMVATEEGIGVRSSGLMASTASVSEGDGGFSIDVNGKLEISAPKRALALDLHKEAIDLTETSTEAKEEGFAPALFSGSSLTIKAKDFANHSILYAAGDLAIQADNVLNQGSLEFEDRVVSTSHFYSRDPNINGFFGGSNTYYTLYDYTITTKEHATKKETYSPALILGGNITIKSNLTTNDTAIIKATNKFDNQSKEFKNIDPQAKRITSYSGTRKVYDRYGDCGWKFLFGKQDWNCGSTNDYYAYNRADDIEYIDNNLPEITAQDMTGYLSEAIRTSRASATTPIAYMQDSTTLNSLLAGSVDAATLIDPSILDIFARGSLSLGIGASSMHITSDDFYNSGSMSADSIYVASSVFINENGEILSGKSLALSGGSVANKGGKISSDSIDIKADNFLNTSSVESNDAIEQNRYLDFKTGKFVTKSSVVASNDNLVSKGLVHGGDIKIDSSQINIIGADNIADRTLEIKSDSISVDVLRLDSKQSSSVRYYASNAYSKDETLINQTTNIVSKLEGNVINIQSNTQDFTSTHFKGSQIALSGNSVNFNTTRNEISTDRKKEEISGGFFYTNRSSLHETNQTQTNIANKIEANTIEINTNGDFIAYNLDVDAKSLAINSQGDVKISNNADMQKNTMDYHSQESGFKLGTNAEKISLSYGNESIDINKSSSDKVHTHTNLKADDINITSGNKLSIESTNIDSKTIDLQAEDVNLSALQNEHKSSESTHIVSDKIGFSIDTPSVLYYSGISALGDKIVGTANNLANEAINNIGLGSLVSVDVKNPLHQDKPENTKIGFSYSHSDDFKQTDIYQTSTNNLKLNATNINITSKQDIKLNNTDMMADTLNTQGQNILISSNEDVNSTKTRHYSDSVDVSLNLSLGKQTGVNFNTSYDHQGKQTSQIETRHNVSNLNINTANLNADHDITIEGANIVIKDDANINAENFTLKAASNTKTSKSDENNYGASVDFTYNGGYSLGLSANGDMKKTSSTETTHTAANLSASNLNLNIKNDAKIQGSNLTADNTTIKAGSLEISEVQDSKTSSEVSNSFDASVSVGFGATPGFGLSLSDSAKVSGDISKTSVGSNVSLGNFDIKTTGSMTIKGSNLDGSKGSIKAENLNILSSENTKASGAMKGDASLSNLSGKLSGSADATLDVTQSHASLNVDSLDIETSKDLNIKGGNLEAKELKADIKGNLNIFDKRDTKASISATGSLDSKEGADYSFDASIKTQVAKDSGIQAQKADIKVGKLTFLRGGVIKADEGKLESKTVIQGSVLTYDAGVSKKKGKLLDKHLDTDRKESSISGLDTSSILSVKY